jgi:hypothetical protein
MDGVLRQPGLLFKRILIAFWALFFSLVALTNLVDLLDTLGAFDWRFLNSENYDYLHSVVKVYDVGPLVTKLLLAGALAIEAIGAVLCWRAVLHRTRPLLALCWGALVWIAFIVMTEFFTAYQSESVFRELLMLTIASALAVALIPDSGQAQVSAGSVRPQKDNEAPKEEQCRTDPQQMRGRASGA